MRFLHVSTETFLFKHEFHCHIWKSDSRRTRKRTRYEVTDRTWEVVGGALEEYDGGYSAYVLAKAERARQQAAMDARRNNLLRKELAWLRRGAPARTSKPKFRVDAANELIATEPPPRDNTELLKFSQNRLGNTVFECQHLQIRAGENVLIEDLVWNIGPGERIGIVGVNGAGKTTLMRTLAGEHFASAGKLVKGVTVKVAMLSQHLAELDPTWRLIEAVERVATRVELGGGRELSGGAAHRCQDGPHGMAAFAIGNPHPISDPGVFRNSGRHRHVSFVRLRQPAHHMVNAGHLCRVRHHLHRNPQTPNTAEHCDWRRVGGHLEARQQGIYPIQPRTFP